MTAGPRRDDQAVAHLVDAEIVLILGSWEAEPAEAASILAGLTETDFTHPACAEGCRAIRAALARGEHPTRLTVRRHLAQTGQAGLWEFLRHEHETRQVVTGAELRAAGQEVRLAASRARARKALRILEASLDAEGYTPDSWREQAGKALGQVGFGSRGQAVHVSELLRRLGHDLEQGTTARDHVLTPFPALNRATGGLGPGQLTLLAARPAMGKTAFASQVARYAALDGRPGSVVYFSFEMSGESIARRVAAQAKQVPLAELTGAQAVEVADQKIPLWVFDLPQRLPAFFGTFEAVKLQVGAIKLVVVDYLGQLARSNSYEDVSQVSRELLNLAKRERLPVLALHQLSRDVERRPDKKPVLSDLRDSGQLEQDAHSVWMLFRAGYYDHTQPKHEAKLFIRKNRDGKTGAVELHWRAETVSFHQVEAG